MPSPIARSSRSRGIPIFYFPFYNKSLLREPRQSGFFTPIFGNSSRYGFMFHTGYYWAINRNYDVSYRIIDYTARGYDHTVYFRGKPTNNITFDFTFPWRPGPWRTDRHDAPKSGGL